jgi:translation initiation factor 1
MAGLFILQNEYMSKKNKPDNRGFVYSTDPDFQFEQSQGSQETLKPAQQQLRIRLETKHRAGKAVTLIYGFIGKAEDLETLGKQLKNYCGTGGSAKDGEIIVQGDQREKVLQFLLKNGYSGTKKM